MLALRGLRGIIGYENNDSQNMRGGKMDNQLSTFEAGALALVSENHGGNPAGAYLAGLASAAGRRSQRQALDTITGMITTGAVTDCTAFDYWPALRYEHAKAIRAQLIARYAPATVNKFIAALRGVMREAWRMGQIPADVYQHIADLPGVRGSTVPAGRAMAAGEISALLQNCANDPTPAGVRDAALIALAYGGGLRREELVTLDLADYDPAGWMLVRGKGRKERTVPVVGGAAVYLAAWLALRGAGDGPLFQPVNKSGKVTPRRMTTQAVYNLMAKRAELAGVRKFSPHDMRRTFVSDLLDAGAGLSEVAKMAGHANPATTARYDRRGDAAKAKAAALLHIPVYGRK